MVGEEQVHAASVDIEFVAEIFLAHNRALEMPAGEAFAPGGRPVHDVLRLRLLPQGEIEGGLLVALAVEAARAFESFVEVAAAQHSVVVVLVILLHVEIDAAVADICVAGVENLLDGLDLLDNMA